ncbi:MAG: hypothetical protein MSG64_17040 [Pyrinomonadaceae bacterium MAG19_C2-C3]|nr:hypothetical protein [Pyrinomonadaceae bacterium MAG19_C2-C3]
MPTSMVILIYGILTLAGGVFAYISVKSVPSIVAGGASGLILIFAGYLMMRGSYTAGWWIALVVTLALLARFGATAFSNFKFMPGGLMIILSIIALVALLLGRAAPNTNL